MNPAQHRVPFFDGLRGVAILIVFLHHALYDAYGRIGLPFDGWFPGAVDDPTFYALMPLTWGLAGVALFFVISGYCIHASYTGSPEQGWRGFFTKRFFRLYPPYLAALVLLVLLKPWLAPSYETPHRAYDWGLHLTLAQNLDCSTFFGFNPSFWSVSTEAQLYLLYPLLVLVAGRFGWGASLAAAGVVEVAWRVAWTVWCFSVEGTPRAPFLAPGLVPSPLAFWMSWALGAYLADAHAAGRTTWLARLPLGGVAAAALATTLFKPLSHFNFLGYAVLSAVLIERMLTGRLAAPTAGAPRVAWGHLSRLGVVSYSFYLLHQPLARTGVLTLAGSLGPDDAAHPWVRLGVSLALYPALFAVAWAMHWGVERPSMRLGARLARRGAQAGAAQAPDGRVPAGRAA